MKASTHTLKTTVKPLTDLPRLNDRVAKAEILQEVSAPTDQYKAAVEAQIQSQNSREEIRYQKALVEYQEALAASQPQAGEVIVSQSLQPPVRQKASLSPASPKNVGSPHERIELKTGAVLEELEGGQVRLTSPKGEVSLLEGELDIEKRGTIQIKVGDVTQSIEDNGYQDVSIKNKRFGIGPDNRARALSQHPYPFDDLDRYGSFSDVHYDGKVLTHKGTSVGLPVPSDWVLSEDIPAQSPLPTHAAKQVKKEVGWGSIGKRSMLRDAVTKGVTKAKALAKKKACLDTLKGVLVPTVASLAAVALAGPATSVVAVVGTAGILGTALSIGAELLIGNAFKDPDRAPIDPVLAAVSSMVGAVTGPLGIGAVAAMNTMIPAMHYTVGLNALETHKQGIKDIHDNPSWLLTDFKSTFKQS